MSKKAPMTPGVTVGPIPEPETVSKINGNVFTEVTIKQLYFFMWKWVIAGFLFVLPFYILAAIVEMLSKGR
jgi:hypothetical protein